MAKSDDGGPAFPTDTEHQPDQHVMHLEGMTLRDWFAGQIMASTMSTPVLLEETIKMAKYLGMTSEQLMARAAYVRADAMLAERNKEPADATQ